MVLKYLTKLYKYRSSHSSIPDFVNYLEKFFLKWI